MGVIYLLTFPDGMKYVGQTVNFDNRMRNHGSGHGHCRKVQEWTHKYGWGNVVKQQLFECVDMNNAEINTITEYGTIWPNGLNLVRGGEAPDGKYVRESWKDPEIRERHIKGRKKAWADPTKRANIIAGRATSIKVEAAKLANKHNCASANSKRTETWETKREARLEGLVGKALQQRIARLDRDRARARIKADEKRRTSSKSLPLPQRETMVSVDTFRSVG